MRVINLTLPNGESAVTGKQITFRTPCDSVTYDSMYISVNEEVFELVDALGDSLVSYSFTEGSLISVILDVENKKAFIQNAVSSNHVESLLKEKAPESHGHSYASAEDTNLPIFSSSVTTLLGNTTVLEENDEYFILKSNEGVSEIAIPDFMDATVNDTANYSLMLLSGSAKIAYSVAPPAPNEGTLWVDTPYREVEYANTGVQDITLLTHGKLYSGSEEHSHLDYCISTFDSNVDDYSIAIRFDGIIQINKRVLCTTYSDGFLSGKELKDLRSNKSNVDIEVDKELNSGSDNPVANSAVTKELSIKVNSNELFKEEPALLTDFPYFLVNQEGDNNDFTNDVIVDGSSLKINGFGGNVVIQCKGQKLGFTFSVSGWSEAYITINNETRVYPLPPTGNDGDEAPNIVTNVVIPPTFMENDIVILGGMNTWTFSDMTKRSLIFGSPESSGSPSESITVDSKLDPNSYHPIANKAVAEEFSKTVKKTDFANDSTGGIVKIDNSYGIEIGETGTLFIRGATKEEIEEGKNSYKPITPSTVAHAVKVIGDKRYATQEQLNDIETSLDTIIAIQNYLIGGAE